MRYSEIVEILNSHPNENIIELMKLVGMDPRVELRNGDWTGGSFVNCNMSGFDCTFAKFEGADFRNADVNKANFNGSILPRSILKAKNLRHAIFDNRQRVLISRWIADGDDTDSGASETHSYLEKIREARKYLSARIIVHDMNRKGLKPNQEAYKVLFSKASGAKKSELILRDFDEFLSIGGELNQEFCRCVFSNLSDYPSAEKFLDKIINNENFDFDEFVFFKMISLSPNYETAEYWLNRKYEFKVKINEDDFKLLMNKTSSAFEFLLVIYAMVKYDIDISEEYIKNAFRKGVNDYQIYLLIETVSKIKSYPSLMTIYRAIHICENFDDARIYFQIMIDFRLGWSSGICDELLTHCRSVKELYQVFSAMNRVGVLDKWESENDVLSKLDFLIKRTTDATAAERLRVMERAQSRFKRKRGVYGLLKWLAAHHLGGEAQYAALLELASWNERFRPIWRTP